MRRAGIALAVAGTLAVGGLVGIAVTGDSESQMGEPTTISNQQLKNATGSYVDRAGQCEVFHITRSGVPTALLTCITDPPPTTTTSTSTSTTTTTTTTTPPGGAAYPLVTSPDFLGDFDPDCDTREFSQVYEESADIQVVSGGPVGCYSKHLPSGSGKHRAELGTPTLPAGSEFTDEFLLYVPSSTSFVGYVRQNKLDETDGSCANGGWSMPQDEGGRLLLRVRSDCDADHRDLDFGVPPKNQWIALWANCKLANSGGFCHARVNTNPLGGGSYGPVKSVTGDTSSGGNIKLRIGPYGSGQAVWMDEYRRDNG
jgi:hypothetical protein